MMLAQRQLVTVLVFCLLSLPLIQAALFTPNGAKQKSIRPSNAAPAARPTKMQVFKAYAKGYGKAGLVMGVMLTVFKAAQIDKLFELIFGKDTSVQDLQEEILNKFDEIEQLITTSTHSTIQAVSENLMLHAKLVPHFHEIDQFLHFLKHQTERMHNFIHHLPTNGTLEDFADSIVQRGNSSVLDQVAKIRQMFDPDQPQLTEQFMDLYAQYLQRTSTNRLCHLTTSPQQTMFDLLRKLIYGELAAFTLIGYAYAVKVDLSTQNGQDKKFEGEKSDAKEEFEKYSTMIQILMQIYLPRLERNYWKCDASVWYRGVTFHELDRMMYGVVEYEDDISNGCNQGCYAFKNPHPFKKLSAWGDHKCSGYIEECASAPQGTFEFCFSNSEASPEMYTYVSSGLMRKGEKEQCQNETVHWVKSFISGVYNCEYCACLCHSEDAATHRYLSLLPQLSNIDENEVIVGVKFVKHNKVLYLQIMQAPMLPYASVDMDKAAWRELDALMMVPPDHFDFPGLHTFNHQNREIYMKELEVPAGTLLTGVKFVVKNGVPDLAIRYTPVDWETGQLDPASSLWMTEAHDTYDTNDMLYQNQLPDQCKTPSFIDTASGQKFKFSTSAMDQDGGQHVLPYFDAQPVVPVSMGPLSGVGITHKADDRCGGFISPVVFTVHEDYMFGDDSGIDPF